MLCTRDPSVAASGKVILTCSNLLQNLDLWKADREPRWHSYCGWTSACEHVFVGMLLWDGTCLGTRRVGDIHSVWTYCWFSQLIFLDSDVFLSGLPLVPRCSGIVSQSQSLPPWFCHQLGSASLHRTQCSAEKFNCYHLQLLFPSVGNIMLSISAPIGFMIKKRSAAINDKERQMAKGMKRDSRSRASLHL